MIRKLRLPATTLFAATLAAGCSDPHQFTQPMNLGGVQVSAEDLNHGKEHYTLYCQPCHGDNGDGKGTSATGLRPPPRDFSQGLFKFGGVSAPALPPDESLVRIVKGGLHGTAMLPWDVPDSDLHDIIQYIKTFSPRWKSEKPGDLIAISDDPFPADKEQEAIETGKKIYHSKAQCSGCHPSYVTHQELSAMTGAEAFSAEMYHSQIKDSEYCLEWKPTAPGPGQDRDTWINNRECAKPVKVMPPDFTRDPIRNVRLPRNASPMSKDNLDEKSVRRDIYRTIASGIGGANMPTWKGALSENELWGLVHYVRYLISLNDPDNADSVAKLKTLRASLDDPANMSWTPPPKAPEPTPAPTGAAPAAPGAAAPAAAKPAAAPAK